MKKFTYLLIAMQSPLLIAPSLGSAMEKPPRKPPQEAINACKMKPVNSQCDFFGPKKQEFGFCEHTPDKAFFACRPEKNLNPPITSDFSLTSTVMADEGLLPDTFTCDGESISPPLSWSNAPKGTTDYAVIMHHEIEANDNHSYWVMYDIPRNQTSISANQVLGSLGTNSVNNLNEYAPPCSQGPGIKKYTFTLYALSAKPRLKMGENVDRNTLLSAMTNITLSTTTLDVNYERNGTSDPIPDPINTNTACTVIKDSVDYAGFNDVSVICDDDYAYIVSDTYPNHDLMNGITGTNEQIPVPAINYAAPIKLSPQIATNLTTIDAAVGVAVNGVPIYDYSSQGELDVYNYDANSDTFALGQLDNCGGHAGRGDDYHYHVSPNCMIASMENKKDSTIIGWAYDGYPLYGDNNPDGSMVKNTDLDVCNGQLDETFGYRYHTSINAPYIIQCLVGEVDTSILPRVSPLSGDNTGARANLTPPRDGVENLQHTISNQGERKMTYDYKGQSYYVIYSPSLNQENCYDFEQKTVSNGGLIETGTFCREDNPLPQGDQQSKVSVLDFSQYETFSDALSEQINRGDGNNIDNYFRNSGVLIDEKQNAYYAVNGVHPINQGDYSSYYPKSVVKASMSDDSIIKAYSFDLIYGHNIDMEALSFGKNPQSIYIGDEYNYIYELDLNKGEIVNQWNLADIGLITNIDKGIEAMSYSATTDNFYVGIQGLEKIISVKLNDNNTVTQTNEFSLVSGWAPSGLFAHKDGSLYVVSMKGGGTAGNQTIYQYQTDGSLMCEITIPNELGIIRPDGIYIDSSDSFIYIADSQGPIYGGSSLYKIAWTNPCEQ